MSKTNFLKIIILLIFISQVLSEGAQENIIEENESIEDMEPSFLKKIANGFHHLRDGILPINHEIIAFADINDDGYTDLITYKHEQKNNFTFYTFTYDKESKKFNKEQKEDEILFYVYDEKIDSIRNLHVGPLYEDSNICFLASFNEKEKKKLSHYIFCNGDIEDKKDKKAKKMNITSNILILNRDSLDKGHILHHNGTSRVLCELTKNNHFCGGEQDIPFANFLSDNNDCLGNKNDIAERKISKDGGLAYVDLNGNCVPDLVVSYEVDEVDYIRHIEIYRADRTSDMKFCLIDDLEVGKSSDYGAFTISRIENDKSSSNIPNFDILIPKLDTNQIIAYKNKVIKEYKWDNLYCDEKKDEMGENKEVFTKNDNYTYNLSEIEDNQTIKFDTEYVTVIRPGDFLGSQNPGILTQFLVNGEKKYIALYSKEGDNFKLFLKISDIKGVAPKRAFFFDISESGRLSLIVQTVDGKNHIFFNYRNTYFIKSKLMNNKELYSDINIGATFRYIVTNQDGDRHMEISSQLPQTSDMNMPLPFSLSGLGETNNYVENFQIMSGNYYKTASFKDDEHKNFMYYTPIIPNTQMKIFKFKNEGKYEWLIELIVQPMDQIVILVIIMIVVMLSLLGVIIYLHVREVKEEQKETTKFKSWFA